MNIPQPRGLKMIVFPRSFDLTFILNYDLIAFNCSSAMATLILRCLLIKHFVMPVVNKTNDGRESIRPP